MAMMGEKEWRKCSAEDCGNGYERVFRVAI